MKEGTECREGGHFLLSVFVLNDKNVLHYLVTTAIDFLVFSTTSSTLPLLLLLF